MKYRINHLLYTLCGICLCYFTSKLFLHSPPARENMTLLVKYVIVKAQAARKLCCKQSESEGVSLRTRIVAA